MRALTAAEDEEGEPLGGWPLGDASVVAPAAMLNIIGTEPDAGAVLAVSGAHLHRYGKAERPDRKIGHVTVIGRDERERDERLAAVRQILAP